MSLETGTWGDHLQSTTRASPRARLRAADAGVPGLTLLCHPDPRRVGEMAALLGLLSGADEHVSRLTPHFAAPEGGAPRPLADPHVSRRTLTLSPLSDGGVRFDPGSARARLAVDGAFTGAPRDLRRAELEDGVVLLLGERIALLLHLLPTASGRRPPRHGLIGESAAMLRVRQEIERLADLDYPVLVLGESGTGKELVAGALHRAGPRRAGPYVCVNIGAIPPTLAAAELFGNVKGAFTGADRQRQGHFQRADGGTLFLDEIGDAPADVQVLLLRALETGEIRPVGAAEAFAVDVRLISATDGDLAAAIAAGEFRAPLFHRLSSYELALPPLRARRDDIGRLFFHFLRQELAGVGELHRLEPDADPWMPAELVARLAACPWPGNVRQLRNAVRQLVVANRGEAELTVPAAVERLLCDPAEAPGDAAAESAPGYRHPGEVSQPELLRALRENRWNVGPTAAALHVSRTSLYALMDKCPLVRKASDLAREEVEAALRRCHGRLDDMVDLLEVSRRGLQLRITELGLSADEAA